MAGPGWKCDSQGRNVIGGGEILYLQGKSYIWGGGVGWGICIAMVKSYIQGGLCRGKSHIQGGLYQGKIPYPGLCHPRCSQNCSNASWGKRVFKKKKERKGGKGRKLKKKKGMKRGKNICSFCWICSLSCLVTGWQWGLTLG